MEDQKEISLATTQTYTLMLCTFSIFDCRRTLANTSNMWTTTRNHTWQTAQRLHDQPVKLSFLQWIQPVTQET